MDGDIGTIRVHGADATLGADLRWRSDEEPLASFLNVAHNGADRSPADGVPGHKTLTDAAAALGGEVVARAPAPDGPELLY